MNGNNNIDSDNKSDRDDNDRLSVEIYFLNCINNEVQDFLKDLIKNPNDIKLIDYNDIKLIDYNEEVYSKLFQFIFDEIKPVNISFHQNTPISKILFIVMFLRTNDTNLFKAFSVKVDLSTKRFMVTAACSFIKIIDETQTQALRDQELNTIQGHKMKRIRETLIFDDKVLEIAAGKWDSKVQFYPTITCLFLESEEAFQARRLLDSTTIQRKVQVKLRVLDYEVGAMTDVDAVQLESRYRDRVDQIKGLSFHTGEVRFTYVNPGYVKWKTTLFARNVSEAQDLLAVLCNYVDQKFYPDCLSYTSSLKNKGNREEPKLPTKVSLWKVSLLINKKAKQIVLYHVNTDY